MRDLNGVYGSNQVFVIFDEYVVVFDASLVDQGRVLKEEILARTDKPVRYVIHSHFHPDHTAGAAILAGEGVEVLAGDFDRENYEVWAREDFAKKIRTSPEQYRALDYPAPTRYVEESEVFDDGQQRLEIIRFGHGHTKGDLVGWLPKQGILLTGDVCENQKENNLANANIAEWIKVLDRLIALPVKEVVPGHSHVGGPEMLEITRRFFVELRESVGAMVSRGMNFEEVLGAVDIPFYKEWTGIALRDRPKSVAVVYREVGGVFPKPKKRLLTKKRLAAALLLGTAAVGIGLIYMRHKRKTRDWPE